MPVEVVLGCLGASWAGLDARLEPLGVSWGGLGEVCCRSLSFDLGFDFNFCCRLHGVEFFVHRSFRLIVQKNHNCNLYIIFHDRVFDWNFCCGRHRIEICYLRKFFICIYSSELIVIANRVFFYIRLNLNCCCGCVANFCTREFLCFSLF